MLNLLVRLRMWYVRHTHWRAVERLAQTPASAQEALLLSILRENARTQYGEQCGFAAITSYEQFAQSVPVASYEALRPYIQTQQTTGQQALTVAPPVLYAKTSGTTGQPKYVPITKEELRQQQRHTALLTFRQYTLDPLAFGGKIWVMAMAAEEGRLDNGVPWGSVSGFLYANTALPIAAKYLIPHEVFSIEDVHLKYRLILRLALAEPQITYFSTANPTTLLKLNALINEQGAALAQDIERGVFDGQARLPANVSRAVLPYMRPDPDRAQFIRSKISGGRIATFADCWPELRMVSMWTGGNCAVPAAAARKLLPTHTKIVELGYLSSEFRGSLTVDCAKPEGLPTILDYFFEFIEPEAWEAGDRVFRLVHHLEPGRDYYVIVTTPSGLYRYFINDIIRVGGYFHATPTIRFLQKGKGVTNITGEKLYEAQLTEALGQTGKHWGFHASFHLMLADVERQQYVLYLELEDRSDIDPQALACDLDQRLALLNVEYAAKRESGRLHCVQINCLTPGAGEAYRAHCIQKGQKEGQFKTISLQYAAECTFCFHSHVREDSAC